MKCNIIISIELSLLCCRRPSLCIGIVNTVNDGIVQYSHISILIQYLCIIMKSNGIYSNKNPPIYKKVCLSFHHSIISLFHHFSFYFVFSICVIKSKTLNIRIHNLYEIHLQNRSTISHTSSMIKMDEKLLYYTDDSILLFQHFMSFDNKYIVQYSSYILLCFM